MPTPAERKALLFVAAVALLGAGVRVARGAGEGADTSSADPALRAQLAAVDSARRERGARKGGAGSRGGARASRSRTGARAPGASGEGQAGRSARSGRAADPPPPPPGAPMVALPLGGVPVLAPAPAGPIAPSTGRRRSRRASARAGAAASRPPSGAPLDLDRASAAEIEALPGIGPVLARRIVEERARGGPFGSLAGLERVRGVGPALVRRLAPHVTFSGVPRQSHVVEPGNDRRSRRRAPAGSRSP